MSVKETNRDIEMLSSPFKEKVKAFISDKRIKDEIFITEGYRSQERQEYLYNQRPRVTWTLSSEHTKGLAIDIAFNSDELYPNDIYTWREIAEIANEYGIDWGWDLWKSDMPHFQDNGKPLINWKNRYLHLLSNEDRNLFNDFYEDGELNAGEIKALISIGIKRNEEYGNK